MSQSNHPFVIPQRSRLFSRAMRNLLVAAILLTTVLALQFGSRYWLLNQLTRDFDNQTTETQLSRLAQLAQLGPAGTQALVAKLKFPDSQVAYSAFEHLRDQQQTWMQLDAKASAANHQTLVAALESLGPDLDLQRGGWVTLLLNQSIAETVAQEHEYARLAYLTAVDLLSRLSVQGQQLVPAQKRFVESDPVATYEPLPLISAEPIIRTSTDKQANEIPTSQTESSGTQTGATPPPVDSADPLPSVPQPTALQQTAPALFEEVSPVQQVVGKAQHVVDAPLTAFTTRSVIATLRSIQPALRDAAHAELQRRGLDDQQIALAERLADPDVRVRLGMLYDLTHQFSENPRPWLLWLAEDPEPQVRKAAISILATMDDQQIQKKLQELLVNERSETVADTLRRALGKTR